MAFKARLYNPEKTEGLGNIDLPDGKYVFEITDAKLGTTQKGNPKIQLTVNPIEGPVTNAKAWDSWNIPDSSAADDHFSRRMWVDIHKAWPFIYDAPADPKADGTVHEELLKGLKYRATVIHENDDKGVNRMRIRYHVYMPKDGAGASATPAATPPPAGDSKPPKWNQPTGG